jgi:hypothetical protein
VERVKLYLDPSTEAKITRVVENELVREQVRGWRRACARALVRTPGATADLRLRARPRCAPGFFSVVRLRGFGTPPA